jgi:NADH:flavin oxidoreductase / NADH oxidase family
VHWTIKALAMARNGAIVASSLPSGAQGSLTTMSSPRLFTPIKVGRYELGHRVVLAPLTRFRANAKHVHGQLAIEYYSQRASVSLLPLFEGAVN